MFVDQSIYKVYMVNEQFLYGKRVFQSFQFNMSKS